MCVCVFCVFGVSMVRCCFLLLGREGVVFDCLRIKQIDVKHKQLFSLVDGTDIPP